MQIQDITPEKKSGDGKIRLAAYCRVSSDSADQIHSFVSQNGIIAITQNRIRNMNSSTSLLTKG